MNSKPTQVLSCLAPPDLKDKLGLENPIKTLSILTRSAPVPVGKRCLKRAVTPLPLPDPYWGIREAVWLSMSHIIADGYTAYAILNMLLCKDDASVMALEPERDHSFDTKLAKLVRTRTRFLSSRHSQCTWEAISERRLKPSAFG